MTPFSAPPEDFAPIYRMLDESLHAPLLITAVNLKIFDKVFPPTSARNLAARAGWHPGNTEWFLNALAAVRLLKKRDGKFKNTSLSRTFLLQSATAYLGDFLLQSFALYAQDPQILGALIQQGPPDMPVKTDNKGQDIEDLTEQNIDVLARVELAGSADLAASIVSNLPEFPRLKRMLDLGGGPGLNCMAIVSAHPFLKGTVFDFPAVTRKTREYIRDYRMADRITTLAGDFTRDDLGCGYDLIWASGVLNFSKDSLEQVMAKLYKALTPGGICISLHDHLIPDGTGPAVSVRRYLPMALAGTDFYLEAGRVANAMARAGLQPADSRSVSTPMGPMLLDIGRVPASP